MFTHYEQLNLNATQLHPELSCVELHCSQYDATPTTHQPRVTRGRVCNCASVPSAAAGAGAGHA